MDFLALIRDAGFSKAALVKYTGFKSSPYTEWALFYGEKLAGEPQKEAETGGGAPPTSPAPQGSIAPGGT